MTRSYSSNGLTFSKSGTGSIVLSKCDVALPQDFEAELTYMGGTAYSIETVLGGMGATYDINGHRTWYYYREGTDSTSDPYTIEVSETWSSGDTLKVKRQNGVLTIYHNNTLKGTFTAPTPLYNTMQLLGFNNSRNTTIKDIKVKPL